MSAQVKTLENKQEFYLVDFMRFFFSLCVIAIHLSPFEEVNPALDFWVVDVLARLAVPYFFVVSGYFAAEKLDDVKVFFGYYKRLLCFYLVYNLIYLPQTVYMTRMADTSWPAIKFQIKAFLVKGLSDHLWFFHGLLVAMLLLFLLKKIMPDIVLFVLGGCVYLTGMVLYTFYDILCQIPLIATFYAQYYRYFFTFRNGLFLGLPLVMIGYALRKYRAHFVLTKWYFLGFAVAFGLMHIEGYFIQVPGSMSAFDLYWVAPLVSFFLFLAIASVALPERFGALARIFRSFSALFYGLHYLVYFVGFLFCNFVLGYVWSRLEMYCIVCGITFILSYVILKLARFKCFAFLRWLY